MVNLSMQQISHLQKVLFYKYKSYTNSTRNGEPGKSAKYYVCTYLIHLCLLLDFACRTNEFELYVYTTVFISHIFYGSS